MYIHTDCKVNVRPHHTGGMSEEPTALCKPKDMTITVSGIGSADLKLNLTWIADEDQVCRSSRNFLVQVAVCADSYITMPPTDVCNISTNTTYIEMDSSTPCPALRVNQPLIFRVKNVECNEEDKFCYPNYLYFPSLKDTGKSVHALSQQYQCYAAITCNFYSL